MTISEYKEAGKFIDERDKLKAALHIVSQEYMKLMSFEKVATEAIIDDELIKSSFKEAILRRIAEIEKLMKQKYDITF